MGRGHYLHALRRAVPEDEPADEGAAGVIAAGFCRQTGFPHDRSGFRHAGGIAEYRGGLVRTRTDGYS